jgi:predicted DNA-binding transcriptional regulator AlpA
MMKNPLPETGYVRLSQIVGDQKATPPIPAIIPVSKSTWWNGVKDGRFPRPVKLGPRVTVWRAEDIRSLIRDGVAS